MLGQPMPAICPYIYLKYEESFFESELNEQEAILSLDNYCIYPEYYNMLHTFGRLNKPAALSERLKQGENRYLSIVKSPIIEATSSCAFSVLQFLTSEDNKDIIARLSTDELVKIFSDFPEESGIQYFDGWTIENKEVFPGSMVQTLLRVP